MSDLSRFVSHLRCLSEPEPVPCQDPTAFQHDGTLRHSLALSCPRCIPQSLTVLICCAGTSSRAFAAQGYATPPLTADRAQSLPRADVRRVRMLCTWAMQMTGGRSRRSRKRRRGTCTNARRSVGAGQCGPATGFKQRTGDRIPAKRMGLRCIGAAYRAAQGRSCCCNVPFSCARWHAWTAHAAAAERDVGMAYGTVTIVGCCNPSA